MRSLLRLSKEIALLTATACTILLVFAGGCNSNRSGVIEPSFELPQAFSVQGSEPMPEKWWQSFDDPQLDTILEEALADNFTIRSAWDRLSQAEQIAIQAGAALYPSATYQGGVDRSRVETSGRTIYGTDYSAGVFASYEVDLWGGIKSRRQAAVLDAEAAQENISAAAMTLTAAAARLWYQLAEARQQHELIAGQIETNRKILEVIKFQFRQGLVGAADVFSQEELIEAGRGQLVQVQENITLVQYQLSTLLGKPPAERWSDQPIELITIGHLPLIEVPAVVIQRRPDVIRAYKTVQAADERLAFAIADQYPTVSLSAVAETSAERTSDLFDDWLGNLAANIAGPLFDAGFRKAEAQRTRAVLSERLNDYSRLVLEALRETEDAISQEHYQRLYLESLQKQLALAQQVYERTYQNYLKGQLDYIRVLTALVSMQRLEQNELTARRVLIERRIDLCRSIAGGWPLQRPEMAGLTSP